MQLEFSGDRCRAHHSRSFVQGPASLPGYQARWQRGCGRDPYWRAVGTLCRYPGGDAQALSEHGYLDGRARLFHGEEFTKIASDPLDLFAHATHKLVAAFIHALENDSTPTCDSTDNRRSLALMFAAYESQRVGAPVTMNYNLDG